MAQVYNIISIVAFSLAGVCLIFSIFSWFKFGILGIIGDFTGRTARKSIAQMRTENEKNGKRDIESTKKKKHIEIKSENDGKKDIVFTPPELDVNSGESTTVLNYGDGATALLDRGTEVLDYNPVEEYEKKYNSSLEIVQSIVLIHTDETI